MCQSASRVKLILGLSSTSKVEDLWTTRLGTAYCQQTTFSLIVVTLCAMQNSSHLFTSAIILSMSERPKFDYGETVQITSKEHNGRIGAVVGINGSESCRTYTVEFGDGSDADIGEEGLSKVKT